MRLNEFEDAMVSGKSRTACFSRGVLTKFASKVILIVYKHTCARGG